MAIKVERAEGGPERLVAAACAVDPVVLGHVAARWRPNGLPSRWASVVVGWCVEYHRRWGKAPGPHLAALFDEWRAGTAEPALVELVGAFVASVVDERRKLKESINPDFAVSQAARLMRRVQVVEAVGKIQVHLDGNDVEAAVGEFEGFRPVDVGAREHLDSDDEPGFRATWAAARAAATAPVVEFDQGLGRFLNPAMRRGGFVAFMGMEKGNKSFWLQHVAATAYEQGRKVAYFEAGDSPREDVLDRFCVRLARRPLELPPGAELPYAVPIPAGVDPCGEERGVARVDPAPWTIRRLLEEDEAWAAFNAPTERGGLLRVCAYPTGTLAVSAIAAQVEQWRGEGWSPDLVVVDYADIMAAADERAEARDQINQTWRGLRAFSLKYSCLTVTATQIRRDGYGAWLLSRDHVAEDKRKLAEVTAMIGINRTQAEVEKQIWRLNYIAARRVRIPANKFVICAGCLDVGNPAIVSVFPE